MENFDDKKKVLVVDDDNNLTHAMVDKLNMSGFNAVSEPNGEEGLKKAFEFHPDIIWLDLMMPKMGGIEMLKRLRMDAWGKNVKVIVLTLLEQPNYIAEAMENNISGYLVKINYDLDEIVTKLQDMLFIKHGPK